MYRLFVGLRPPAAVRAQLLELMTGVVGARWQDDDQLHITLRFIGEVDGAVANDVVDALAVVRAAAPTVTLAGVGTFASRGRTTTLWAGVEPRATLAALHRKIDTALVRAGLPPEQRAYHPHITLARLNAASGPVDGFLATHAALASVPFTLSEMLLFESSLGADGASYRVAARFALGDGR